MSEAITVFRGIGKNLAPLANCALDGAGVPHWRHNGSEKPQSYNVLIATG